MQMVPGGQASLPVHIFPFRMTEENMKAHEGDKWMNFWKNLKESYDLFELTGEPPTAEPQGESYGFRGRI
ncbi:MAG: hypothetical protein KA099_06260 [Alphaproteobacteria bacterium]|nr:hypothetical protein [Alphaproteobacteria bacterium]MBP7759879.1 hypothetical protein [Alphaproteobacteria bacterium]MBP7763278.1 hypothetical protein [Alphaproteobacteria bacterium]MBP7904913.1 hypothetical protein [Alphaproteobacteria bacterium]